MRLCARSVTGAVAVALVGATVWLRRRRQRPSQLTLRLVLPLCWLLGCGCGSDDDAHAAMSTHDDAHADQLDDDFHGCPDGIPSVAPGLHADGDHLAVQVVGAMPEEPERFINEWRVKLESRDGSPAPDATIDRGQTFMPIHGHDGGVQPRATALPEPGELHVGGLNFTMRGPWEVRFWLRSESNGDDYVVFTVCVAK